MDVFKAQQPAATATATVVAPPAVPDPPAVLRLREGKNFPWRRLGISLMGIVIIIFIWRWSINHLYTLPVTSIAVFGSITNNTIYVIAFLVAYFVTGQAYFTNWSNISTSTLISEVRSYIESKKADKDDNKKPPAKPKK
jgi:hypothetical protein